MPYFSRLKKKLLIVYEFTLIIKLLPHICLNRLYFVNHNGANMMPGGPVGLSKIIRYVLLKEVKNMNYKIQEKNIKLK